MPLRVYEVSTKPSIRPCMFFIVVVVVVLSLRMFNVGSKISVQMLTVLR